MASFSLLLSKGQRNLTILKFMLKNTSAFFNVEQKDEKKRIEDEKKQSIAMKNEAERKRKEREVGHLNKLTHNTNSKNKEEE